MKRIALVTDSTTDLTRDMQAEFGVHAVKLKVVFGEKTFLDGELSGVEFFLHLLQFHGTPGTPPPEEEDFAAVYKGLLDNHDEIISIHLSEAMSSTITMAREARKKLGASDRIHLVDSGSVSVGTALQVAEAARGIRNGLEVQEILAGLKDARANTETMYTLDTLTFLRRNRRVSLLKGMIASFLNLKPLIRINAQGVFESAGGVRDQDLALKTLVKLFRDKAAGRRVLALAVAHGSAREPALRLKKSLENAFRPEESFFTEVGPAVGVYTGPGVIGAAVRYAGSDKDRPV